MIVGATEFRRPPPDLSPLDRRIRALIESARSLNSYGYLQSAWAKTGPFLVQKRWFPTLHGMQVRWYTPSSPLDDPEYEFGHGSRHFFQVHPDAWSQVLRMLPREESQLIRTRRAGIYTRHRQLGLAAVYPPGVCPHGIPEGGCPLCEDAASGTMR